MNINFKQIIASKYTKTAIFQLLQLVITLAYNYFSNNMAINREEESLGAHMIFNNNFQ